jgi:hypothetical protein
MRIIGPNDYTHVSGGEATPLERSVTKLYPMVQNAVKSFNVVAVKHLSLVRETVKAFRLTQRAKAVYPLML